MAGLVFQPLDQTEGAPYWSEVSYCIRILALVQTTPILSGDPYVILNDRTNRSIESLFLPFLIGWHVVVNRFFVPRI